jgi:hypothetical protein
MHPHSPLADSLVKLLAREEALLRAALDGAADLYDALRKGDLPAALGASTQDALATELRAAADARAVAAAALARAAGIGAENPSLKELAATLGPPHAAELLAARDRLAAVAADLSEVQSRNANLVNHLRSFFRGVLSDLTPAAPARYGPSGSRVGTLGGSVQASG